MISASSFSNWWTVTICSGAATAALSSASRLSTSSSRCGSTQTISRSGAVLVRYSSGPTAASSTLLRLGRQDALQCQDFHDPVAIRAHVGPQLLDQASSCSCSSGLPQISSRSVPCPARTWTSGSIFWMAERMWDSIFLLT